SSPTTMKRDKEKSHHKTYDLLQEGFTIAEIATQRGLSERTIENHIIKCAEEGMDVNRDSFIREGAEELSATAVEEADAERLTPIKQLLPEEISFFMIRAYLEKQ